MLAIVWGTIFVIVPYTIAHDSRVVFTRKNNRTNHIEL